MRLTQRRLKKLLSYNPETGKFVWLEKRSNVIGAGMVAGSLTVSGYISIQVDGIAYRASHLAVLWMKGRLPKFRCDHKDGNRQNDKWVNIREATQSQNAKNRKRNENNKLGIKGVHLFKGKFKAQIQVDGRKMGLGTFSSVEKAADAYISAAGKYHGNFANYGVPPK